MSATASAIRVTRRYWRHSSMRRVVGRVAERDQILVGDHDPLAQQPQQGQVVLSEHLLRAMHNVRTWHAVDCGLVREDFKAVLAAEHRFELRSYVVRRDDDPHRSPTAAGEGERELRDVHLGAAYRRPERAGVEGHAQLFVDDEISDPQGPA